MKAYMQNRKGFTLLELILVMALLSIVLIPLSTFFISNYNYFHKSNQQIEAQEQAEKAINSFSERIMNAKFVAARNYVGNNPANSVERIVFAMKDGSYLIFQYMDENADGERDAICVEKSNDVDHYIASTSIQNTIRARNVIDFDVLLKPDDINLANSNLVQLGITTTDNSNKKKETVTVRSEVSLRNFGR